MSEMLGWFLIVAIVLIVSFFLIAWHLDILDRKEAQKREAELKWRSVRRSK